ncbi:MAG: methylaspartate mutase accessory protein GlmL [Salinirussus sp.]
MAELLLDIGSTHTKAVAVEIANRELLATAASPTTVDTDVRAGVRNAAAGIASEIGLELDDFDAVHASSSAAGGLRLVAVGLVPDLTARAANYAAASAGAKVVDVFSYGLSRSEVEEIRDANPDVILLAGGTDGGNEDVLLDNASALADAELACPVVVAGNKSAADEAADRLRGGGIADVRIADNVMPRIDELRIEPARETIRDVFMDSITEAKGIAPAEELVYGGFVPTPPAVLDGVSLLGETWAADRDLLVVEVGGATTDVYSVAEGDPTRSEVRQRGLDEPYVKRTVEGDLGVRWSAPSVVDAAHQREIDLEQRFGLSATDLDEPAATRHASPETLPETDADARIDAALAHVAVTVATDRHAGTLDRRMTPDGEITFQEGKDLTEVPLALGAGGVIVHNPDRAAVLDGVRYDDRAPDRLKPRSPTFYYDSAYVLFAVGLLARHGFDREAVGELFESVSLEQVGS